MQLIEVPTINVNTVIIVIIIMISIIIIVVNIFVIIINIVFVIVYLSCGYLHAFDCDVSNVLIEVSTY